MKKLTIVLSSLAVIALVVFGHMLTKNQATPENPGPVGAREAALVEEETSVKPFSGKGSLSDLLARAQDLECTIEFVDTRASSTVIGTYFTSAGKMRGDFEVPTTAETVVASMILRDNRLYTWTTVEGNSYGMQIDLATRAEVATNEAAPDTNEPVPLDAPVTYLCTPWTAKDESIFELPRDTIFKDYAALMESGMEDSTIYGESGFDLPAGSPCALCDQVAPGAGQAECKARFQCE